MSRETTRRRLAAALLAGSVLWIGEVARATGEATAEEPAKSYHLAATGSEVDSEWAMERVRRGDYQMTVIVEQDGSSTVLLYREARELAAYLPAGAIDRLSGESSGDALDQRWLGRPFAPLELVDLDGAAVAWPEAGGVVVLNFWFLACPPCVAEIPQLNEVVDRYAGERVTFLALTFDGVEELEPFLDEHPFRYRIVPTSDALLDGLGVSTYPSHLVIGRDGLVSEVTTGYQSGAHLAAAIDRALAAGPGARE